MNKQKGFTLIELLVSISIIGILVTLVMVNLGGLQARGRDSQRKTALATIASALELYYTDVNAYPVRLPAPGSALTYTPPSGTAKTYLREMPNDPRPTTTSRLIYCVNDATTPTRYNLYANLENDRDSDRFCKVTSATAWSASTVTCDYQSGNNCSALGDGSLSNFSNFTVDYTISEQ